LSRALSKVQVYGWNEKAISAAIEELGYSSSLIGLFPNGAYNLVDYFMRLANHNSLLKLTEQSLNDLTLSEKLELALKLRLEEILPYASSWPQAMAMGATPPHLKDTIQRLNLYIDDVWHVCGDRTTDLQWYTRRGSLLSIYVATELYMTTDRSANYAATWKFLHHRIQNISSAHSFAANGLDMAEQAVSIIGRVACSAISAIDPRRR
jgi:ubiquinone biosynthesis protein COQ9